MERPSRRTMLELCAGSSLVMSSGCLGVFGDSVSDEAVQFCQVRVLNEGDMDHEVKIRINEDGNTIYETTEELAATDENSTDSLHIPATELPVTHGEFLLYIQVDNEYDRELYLPDQGTDPVGILMSISGDPPSLPTWIAHEGNDECEYLQDDQ